MSKVIKQASVKGMAELHYHLSMAKQHLMSAAFLHTTHGQVLTLKETDRLIKEAEKICYPLFGCEDQFHAKVKPTSFQDRGTRADPSEPELWRETLKAKALEQEAGAYSRFQGEAK